jgi:hypothetical protein
MNDPVIQFQNAGFDDELVQAAFESAQHALSAMVEMVQAAADVARSFFEQLTEALRPLVETIVQWVKHHWRAIRVVLGPAYCPETIMREKMRRYVRSIGKINTY